MKDNFKLGAILAVVGAIIGLLLFYQFVLIYNPMIAVETNAGRPDEANVVRLVFPILGYLSATAGVLWILALYAFLMKEKWAWMLGLIGSTIALLTSFFPMIPALSRKEVPITVIAFGGSLILWLALMFVRKVNWKIAVLAFVGGLAYVLSFMDGVATIDKIQLSAGQDFLNGMYTMVQQVNWWGTMPWAVFIFALLGRKSWAQIVGLGAGLMAMLGGYPLAIVNMLEEKRFSMFAPSPLLSTALVIVLLAPVIRKMLLDWASGREAATAQSDVLDAARTMAVVH